VLKDLSKSIDECRIKFDGFPFTSDIEITPILAEKLKASIQGIEPNSSVNIYPYSIRLTNDKGLRTDLASSSLWFGAAYHEFATYLEQYRVVLETITATLKRLDHLSVDIKALLKLIPSADWRTHSNTALVSDFINEIDNFFGEDTRSKVLFCRFLDERDWWFKPFSRTGQTTGKTLDRSDVYQSAILLAAKVIVASSDRLSLIIEAFSLNLPLRQAFSHLLPSEISFTESVSTVVDPCGVNQIYYGAPGTGKSHKIDELATNENSIRTVFHSETQYSDFVGCLKPCMVGRDISYQFRPGPFVLALVKAAKEPLNQYFLVIEEINRAAAAAVFGDIFQLLDRRFDGRSRYSIDVVDTDFKNYLETHAAAVLTNGKLILPSNLSLLATMNSSDQAVMPMDSAFKRRWQFEYVSIESDKYPLGYFIIKAGTDSFKVTWEVLSKEINTQLSKVHIPEDRLLGPWFVSEKELENSQATLAGKLAMYLWEDVLRHGDRGIIFNIVKSPTLYQLINAIKANEVVFDTEIINELRKNSGEPMIFAEA
jgi:5-methylcytosine-specific restriction protein B